jgi:hypothetical protein
VGAESPVNKKLAGRDINKTDARVLLAQMLCHPMCGLPTLLGGRSQNQASKLPTQLGSIRGVPQTLLRYMFEGSMEDMQSLISV